jgi:hypothetical protein
MLAVIESAAPESAEEIRALAKASGVPLLAIVALNCFDEIGLVDAIETEVGRPSRTHAIAPRRVRPR